jgi:drug/metabolite transporter (DMT)-like permease
VSNRAKGIFFIVLSAALFAGMNMFVKLSGDLPVFQKVFFRNAIAALIAFIVLLKNKMSLKPSVKGSAKYLILRTSFGLLGIICNYYALDRLVLSDASILNKMSPFFAVVFAYIFTREKPKLYQWLTLAGALFGAMFVIKPSFANAAFVPALVGFLGGVGAGAAYGCVRRLGLMGEKNPYIVFFFSSVSTVVVLPVALIGYQPMSLIQLIFLLSAGVCAALAQFSITAAYTYAPPKEISVYDFSQIIFASLLSLIVFSELPDTLSLIGYLIIVSMAVLNYLIGGRIKRSKPENSL